MRVKKEKGDRPETHASGSGRHALVTKVRPQTVPAIAWLSSHSETHPFPGLDCRFDAAEDLRTTLWDITCAPQPGDTNAEFF